MKSTTHRKRNPEEPAKAGVSEDLARRSIVLEPIDDLKADIDLALAASPSLIPGRARFRPVAAPEVSRVVI